MTKKTYNLFKELNPSIRTYEQDGNKVKITCACKAEIEKVEAFISTCNSQKENTCTKVIETTPNIIIEVVSDYQFSKKIIKDFFGG